MPQKLSTPEQVAEYLGVSPNKVPCLLRSKQLGCAYVGSARRITEAQITQHLQLASSRSPRKRRPRPQISVDLSPIWQQLVDVSVANQPLLAPFMNQTALTRINTQTRTALVTVTTTEAANVIMAE